MKRMKRLFCLLLVGIMILGLVACGKDGETSNGGNNGNDGTGNNASANNTAAKQNVFKMEEIDIGLSMENMSFYSMIYANDRLYMLVQDYGGMLGGSEGGEIAPRDKEVAEVAIDSDFAVDGGMEVMPEVPVEEVEYTGPSYYIISCKLDGSDRKDTLLQIPEGYINGWMNPNLLSDGSAAAIYEMSFDDYTDPNNPVWTQQFILLKWDAEGNLVIDKDITPGEGEYIYAQNMRLLADGNLQIMTGNNQIIVFDKEGNEVSNIKMDEEVVKNFNYMIPKADGNMYITSFDDNWTKQYISEVNITTGTLVGEKMELPGNLANYGMSAGGDLADFILNDNIGLYTYNIGDAEPKKLMDYINSDIATYGFNNIQFLDEKTFVASYNDTVDWTTRIGKFTYVDPSTIPDKQTLVLGVNYLNSDVKKRVIDFNKASTNYRITIKDYNSYNTMEDYTLAQTQMNNDIISGQMPDIMTIYNDQDITSWVNKGLLADIGQMIANDPELSKIEYVENVFDAFKVNDTLYTVVPGFNVQTMIARKDMVGDISGWTMTEFREFMKKQPAELKPFGDDMLREQFLSMVISFCGNDFVDVNTGKCNFDSEEFMAMLEYANTFPKEYAEDYWNDYDWRAMESMYREKKALMLNYYMSRVQDMVHTIHGTLGAEAAFVGFPGTDGNGSILYPAGNMYVLSAKSQNLDGAWEFVRGYLTEEYQTSEDMYSMPVMKSAFEAQAKKAMEKPYWINEETGEKEEYDYTTWINDEEVILEPFTQEEVQAAIDFIYSVDKRAFYNQDIMNIINEEAASFFEGQKSARDVAQIIQSRVQIFVDENR